MLRHWPLQVNGVVIPTRSILAMRTLPGSRFGPLATSCSVHLIRFRLRKWPPAILAIPYIMNRSRMVHSQLSHHAFTVTKLYNRSMPLTGTPLQGQSMQVLSLHSGYWDFGATDSGLLTGGTALYRFQAPLTAGGIERDNRESKRSTTPFRLLIFDAPLVAPPNGFG